MTIWTFLKVNLLFFDKIMTFSTIILHIITTDFNTEALWLTREDQHHPLHQRVKALVRKWTSVAQWGIEGRLSAQQLLKYYSSSELCTTCIQIYLFLSCIYIYFYASFASMELVKLVLLIALLLTKVSCQEKDIGDWKKDFEEVKKENSCRF